MATSSSTIVSSEEDVTTPAAPGSDTAKPISTTVRTQDTVLTVEYARSARVNDMVAGMIKALPAYIDDVTRDFGADLYERMMLGPQTASVINLKRAMAVSKGFRLAVHEDVPEADKEEAQKYVDLCQRSLANMTTPLSQVMWEMSACSYLGHKIAEQVFREEDVEGYGTLLMHDRMKVKPHGAVTFAVDDKYNVYGYVATQSGQYGTPTLMQTSNGKIEGLLDKRHFLAAINNPIDGNPQGSSDLRPVYTVWWMSTQLLPEYLRFLAVQAVPSLNEELPPETPEFTDVVDEFGIPTGVRVLTADLHKTALEGVQNGGVIVSTGKIGLLQSQSKGEVFIAAFEWLDREIAKGVTGQTLATEGASYDTLGASQTHQDTLSFSPDRLTETLAHMLRDDSLRVFLQINFGEEIAKRFTPDVQTAAAEQQDEVALLTAFAEAFAKGLFEPEQMAWVYERLGAPPIDPAVLAQRELDKQAQAKALQDAQAQAQAAQQQGQGSGEQPPPGDQQPPPVADNNDKGNNKGGTNDGSN